MLLYQMIAYTLYPDINGCSLLLLKIRSKNNFASTIKSLKLETFLQTTNTFTRNSIERLQWITLCIQSYHRLQDIHRIHEIGNAMEVKWPWPTTTFGLHFGPRFCCYYHHIPVIDISSTVALTTTIALPASTSIPLLLLSL